MKFNDPRLPARFWAKVQEMPDGCWQWLAALGGRGYGHFKVAGAVVTSHGFAYRALVGAVPGGMELDHLCRNRACVNPTHLEPVPPLVNNLRGDGIAAIQARKTHCKRGHEFTPENTHRYRTSRVCRTCRRDYFAARRSAA